MTSPTFEAYSRQIWRRDHHRQCSFLHSVGGILGVREVGILEMVSYSLPRVQFRREQAEEVG